MRDTKQIPLMEEGGIEGFLRREAPPYAADGWCASLGVRVGYGSSFTRYFCKPLPLRMSEGIRAEIMARQHYTEGPLAEVPSL